MFSFDSLAEELMARPLAENSCGGIHILYALTILLRVDAMSPILTPGIRARLENFLNSRVSIAGSAQQPDGSWTLRWQDVPGRPHQAIDTTRTRFLVTGHMLEWFAYLPTDMQPERVIYERAVTWLRLQLSDMDPLEERGQFCPWTHAVCGIRNLVATHAASSQSAGITPMGFEAVVDEKRLMP